MSEVTPKVQRSDNDKAVLMLAAIIELSDRVKTARGPLDAQGHLLALQASIQKNRSRCVAMLRDLQWEIDRKKSLTAREPGVTGKGEGE